MDARTRYNLSRHLLYSIGAMQMHCKAILESPRNLTRKEEELLLFLLSREFPGRDALRKQLNGLLVSGKCSCGCPSIMLLANKELAAPANVTRRVPIEASCATGRDGTEAHFMLHVVDGWLVELEAYRDDGSHAIDIPDISELRLFCLDW